MKRNIKESSTAGATSAGAIATCSTGLHFPLSTRLPKTDVFGYTEYKPSEDKNKKK